jgi:uncharacterized protein (DUF4415 family)
MLMNALFWVNVIIAIIYALILWVMYRQQRTMSEQQRIMAQQLREMERARFAAHRPVLVVRKDAEEAPAHLKHVFSLRVAHADFVKLENIGVGSALNIRVVHHEGRNVIYEIRLSPIAAGRFSEPFDIYRFLEVTIIYEDIFGNNYWTHYLPKRHTYQVGEGSPTHLAGDLRWRQKSLKQ